VCAAEVAALAGTDRGIGLSRREITWDAGDAGVADQDRDAGAGLLLGLRTADDVFLRVGVLDGAGPGKEALARLAPAAASLDWPGVLDRVRGVRRLPERVAYDIVASIEGRRRYSRFDVEASIGAALAPALGGEFLARDASGLAVGNGGGSSSSSSSGRPDLTVRVFVRDERATIAVRLWRTPLHRRVYKADTGPGTLHPPAAAALAALAAPEEGTLADPFCGDGTIAIEAALARPGLTVLASDIDPERVTNARRNAERAGVPVTVSRADAWQQDAARADALVTNPPWSQAVGLRGRPPAAERGLWDLLAGRTGEDGVLCCLADAGMDLPGQADAAGWAVTLHQQIRIAGRVAQLLLAGPPGTAGPALPAGLASWRQRAIAAGVVTGTGF
jgi:hypothetical protein